MGNGYKQRKKLIREGKLKPRSEIRREQASELIAEAEKTAAECGCPHCKVVGKVKIKEATGVIVAGKPTFGWWCEGCRKMGTLNALFKFAAEVRVRKEEAVKKEAAAATPTPETPVKT